MQRISARMLGLIALIALVTVSYSWLRSQQPQQVGTLATPNFLPLVIDGAGEGTPATPGPTPTATLLPTSTPYPTVDLEEVPRREGQRPDERPALALASITLSPAYPVSGEPVDIAVKIANTALANVPNVLLRLYVGDEELAAPRVDLLANRSTTFHFAWTPPEAGMVAIVAALDPEQEFIERNLLDNAFALDVAVASAVQGDADLAVNGLQVDAAPGQPTMLRATVQNKGGDSGQVPLLFRADGKIVATLLLDPIGEGAQRVVEVPFAVEPVLAQLSVEVNPRFKGDEANAGDNMATLDLLPAADLLVDGLAVAAAQVEPEQPVQVTISFRIVNAGSEAISVPFTTRIFPGEQDPGPDVTVNLQAYELLTNGIPAGGVVYASRTLFLSAGENNFDVEINVDLHDEVEEANEGNNEATLHYKNPAPDVNRWISIGPRRMSDAKRHGYGWNDSSGRLSTIAIDPTAPQTFYVGAIFSGVWKTTNGGASWQSISDSMPTVNVAALALDPTNPARLFWVSANNGVFRSENAGTSWTQISTMNLDAIVHGGKLIIDPSNPNRMFVASNAGVYRSTDGGVTWQLVLIGGAATGLVIDPTNASRLYAAIYHESNSTTAGLYASTNNGGDWREMVGCAGGTLPTTTAKTKITLAMSGSKLFAGYRAPDSFRLFRTSATNCTIGGFPDRGFEVGWTTTDQGQYSVLWGGMWADPTDSSYLYLGGTHVWRSVNGGNSFDLVASLGGPPDGAHSDNHGFAVSPASPATIYMLNDGGIYRSDNHGAAGSYLFIGDGLANGEIYDLADARTEPDLLIIGTQDNGTLKYDGSSTVWNMISGGDGATVDSDPTNAQILYFMGQYAASIRQSTNGGTSSTNIAGGLPTGSTCFNFPWQVHPAIPTTLIAACSYNCTSSGCQGGVWRTTNPGSNWSILFTPATGAVIRTTIDASVDLYYAGTNNGRLYGGPGGGNWRELFVNPAGASAVTDIEIDLDTPTFVYVSFSRTGSGRIFRLQRTSAQPTSMNGADITADLPSNLRVSSLAVDRMNPFTLYAGTQNGVYRGRSSDNGVSWHWTAYINGMPVAANVIDLEVHPTTGVMRAATYGRSVYEVNTDFPIGSLLAAQGRLTFLRVHDVGTGFGPNSDFLDVEVVIQLDTYPGKSFGFQLRTDDQEVAHKGMLDLLRDAFNEDYRVRVDYVRTGLHNGRILRVLVLP